MEQKNISLKNGLNVLFVGRSSKVASACLAIGIGHVTEPKLALANVFEHVLMLKMKDVLPVFGGSMTAYTASGQPVETLEKLAQVFNAEITPELVEQAKTEIIRHTNDSAPLTVRRAKLLYKHTAFGADLVKTTAEYIAAVQSYTVDDVKAFAKTYYVAGNAVLVLAMKQTKSVDEALERLFAEVPKGRKAFRPAKDIYTGGAGKLNVNDGATRVMLGFNVQHLDITDSPAVNVMMSMFLRRLERAYAEAGIDATVELKIAGYYGLRTMRATVTTVATVSPRTVTEVLLAAINRIADTEASESRLERSRNAAMVEKLDKYERSDDAALEMAWQLVGRGTMYDVSNRINSIWQTSAHDVKVAARQVFRGSKPTYIVVAPEDADALSYEEVKKAIKK